jgi:hypothetical protein
MVLLFYFIINSIVFILFIKSKKGLHILEVIVYWLVSSYLFQNFSALCYMNFKTLLIPNQLNLELAHFLNRIILIPIIMVLFLQFLLKMNTMEKKLVLLLTFIVILTGLEWLSDWLGVLNHVNWKLWWSFSYWLAALLTLVGFMKFFRRLLFKGAIKL